NPISVRDEYGGKVVKCPKCKKPMQLPRAGERQVVGANATGAVSRPAKKHNPLLDLLDEAGVESSPTGPVCDNCAAPMHPTAVVCIECGYNQATGQQLETAIVIDESQLANASDLTDAEKLMARAEQSLDESRYTAEGEDFGDGSESVFVAIFAAIALMAVVGFGLFLVLSMDWILETANITAPEISLVMSLVMYMGCAAWISFIAFRASSTHGIISISTFGIYAIIFAFTQGKSLVLPAVIMLVSLVILLVSYLVVTFSGGGGDEFAFVTSTVAPILV
ncbi:MAG: hypothetical protein R3C03_23710, partial [Pirellulaceae bacterium]